MIYLDTSAAAKLLIDEAETAAMREYFTEGHRFLSSRLIEVELHAVADRRGLDPDHVDEVLQHVNLVPLDNETLAHAVALHSGLRTLDSLHLATAVRLSDVVDGFLTFDQEQRAAAEKNGLSALP